MILLRHLCPQPICGASPPADNHPFAPDLDSGPPEHRENFANNHGPYSSPPGRSWPHPAPSRMGLCHPEIGCLSLVGALGFSS